MGGECEKRARGWGFVTVNSGLGKNKELPSDAISDEKQASYLIKFKITAIMSFLTIFKLFNTKKIL